MSSCGSRLHLLFREILLPEIDSREGGPRGRSRGREQGVSADRLPDDMGQQLSPFRPAFRLGHLWLVYFTLLCIYYELSSHLPSYLAVRTSRRL